MSTKDFDKRLELSHGEKHFLYTTKRKIPNHLSQQGAYLYFCNIFHYGWVDHRKSSNGRGILFIELLFVDIRIVQTITDRFEQIKVLIFRQFNDFHFSPMVCQIHFNSIH